MSHSVLFGPWQFDLAFCISLISLNIFLYFFQFWEFTSGSHMLGKRGPTELCCQLSVFLHVLTLCASSSGDLWVSFSAFSWSWHLYPFSVLWESTFPHRVLQTGLHVTRLVLSLAQLLIFTENFWLHCSNLQSCLPLMDNEEQAPNQPWQWTCSKIQWTNE